MALNFQNNGHTRLSRVLLVAFLVASVLLMTLYAAEGQGGFLHRLQTQVHALCAPFQAIGTSGGALAEGASQAVGDATADASTLSELRRQNEELTELLTQTEEYRLEIERLQGLLNLKETYNIEGVSGRVIGHSTDAWNQTITIDIGSSSGVEAGLTVLGPSGVVGQVVSVSAGSSTVRLLTDPSSGVAAMIQSTRAEGIVRGSLNGLLHLENVDEDVVVEVGDVVLTSGLGGSFTRGLLIGQVVRVTGKASDDTRTIVVAANEQAASLEEVMVVFSAFSDTGEGSSAPGDAEGGQPSSEDAEQDGEGDAQ